MPNWCWNELIVCGEPELIEELAAAVLTKQEGEFGARWLLEFEDFDADCEDNVMRSTPEELRVGFSSRSAPPVEFVKALSAHYSELWFGLRFDEPSNEIFGALQCREGRLLGDGLGEQAAAAADDHGASDAFRAPGQH